nr:DUF4954 family protein [Paludibacteraceae bacterium]
MRQLQEKEIAILEQQGCTAEDWTQVLVSNTFKPAHVRRVDFYGHIELGDFSGEIEVAEGFRKHSGIRNAVLRDVTIGNNCLIENVRNYINNCRIGDNCLISNVGTIETTKNPSFGEGHIISVLNENGNGNVKLFSGLNSQLAALMVKYEQDQQFTAAIHQFIQDYIDSHRSSSGHIGNNVRLVNTIRITNCRISSNCVVDGAAELTECTLVSIPEAGVKIGTGVICKDSVIYDGSIIGNGAKLEHCFVGEACRISDGFTAESSLFFANCEMFNGEACAAFCGPFSVSHHKSSLLIGGMYSFYNAGSSTNFSNHAYKMGPLHWGILERGTKTASGSYILMPAQIGTFSVCFGKLMYHPDTRKLPFSYLVSYGDEMVLVPGRNLTTVGLYRDIRKWPKRDKRPVGGKNSIINFDWLSPFSVGAIMVAKRTLEALYNASGDVQTYNFHDYVIRNSSLKKGIKYYDIALRIYIGAVMKRHKLEVPKSNVGTGKWTDLSGMLLPVSEEERIVEEIKSGKLDSVDAIRDELVNIHENYAEYRWAWSHRLICEYYGLNNITEADAARIREDYIQARRAWIAEIRKDAEKEYHLGDVSEGVLQDFIQQLDSEVDFENLKYYL